MRIDPWGVLAALRHPVVVVDEAGEIVYRNPAAIEARVAERGVAALFDAASSERLTDAIRDVVARRISCASIPCATSEGSFSVDVRAYASDAAGAVLEYRDITAIKKTESALRSLEERFRTLVDGSPDIVFITDASSRMRYANAALEEQTGYSVADFQMPQAENQLVHPDDRKRVTAFLAEFVASGRKYSAPLKNRFVTRDGRVLWYSSIVSRSEYLGEPVLQFVVHNITEQEEAREELARMQRQLYERERLAAVGELAAIVAHEIRNPLAIIYNALTTLRKKPPASDTTTLIAIVEDEAARLQRTVRDLLDFTRPMALSFETCDLESIVKDALTAIAFERCDAGGVVVSWAPGDPPYMAEVDRHMIHRAILNLLANAFQATPSGGEVTITLQRTEGEHGPAIELTIGDSGPGIPSDIAARLFEPFVTTRATGTGLGLALVKRIVEMNHGAVSAKNGEGGGARFTLSVPVVQPGSNEPKH